MPEGYAAPGSGQAASILHSVLGAKRGRISGKEERAEAAGASEIVLREGHMPTETREVMDIREAAAYLGISVDTMYKYAADGIVPGFKIGGRIWRFKKSKVDEWMDQQSDNQGEIK